MKNLWHMNDRGSSLDQDFLPWAVNTYSPLRQGTFAGSSRLSRLVYFKPYSMSRESMQCIACIFMCFFQVFLELKSHFLHRYQGRMALPKYPSDHAETLPFAAVRSERKPLVEVGQSLPGKRIRKTMENHRASIAICNKLPEGSRG